MNYKQIIYFGAPGTGKSYVVKKQLNGVANENIFRTTIHPEFTYSDFVGQLLPESDGGTGVKFVFKPGPFTESLKKAYSDSSVNVYLILEEISRGNVAAILGDIFQLLDRDEYFESFYPIRNKNVADQIVEIIGDDIKLPSNFNIIGTVNTNDQSVFPMDTAFKRRFDWEYVSIHPVLGDDGTRLKKLNNPKIIIHKSAKETFDLTWQAFYTSLNEFITDKEKGLRRNEDRQIGQFFLDFNEALVTKSHSVIPNEAEEAQIVIKKMIKNKLLLYLWQDVQGSSSLNGNSLFESSIASFDTLYSKSGSDKIFNDKLINEFLYPNKDEYGYS
jgi:5-methylcytosine-specific restriction protein B